MKKMVLVIMSLLLALSFFSGCGSNSGTSGGSGGDLLNYIPEDVSGYLSVNVKGLSSLEIFNEIEKDFKPTDKFENYKDFVEKTGIDPRKDINGIVAGFYGNDFTNKKDLNFIMVAGLKYDKEKLLKLASEEGSKFKEDKYDGLTLYNIEEGGKITTLVFPDAGHIIVASTSIVKKAIDLFKGKGNSVLKNDKQKSYLKMINNKSLFSMVFNIPEQFRVKKNVGMGEVDFTKAECFIGSAWRSGSAYEIDLKLLLKDKAANDAIKNILNMGKMMGASQPDYKELIEGIKINSDENMLNIIMTITDDFILKMKDKAKSMMGK